MADYSSPNRVGRFGFRTPASITTFVKVDDRRSDQGPDVGRAEISEEHVVMPVSVTEGVVTKIETIVERVYTTSATANTDGFTTNGSSNLNSNSGSGARKPIRGTSNRAKNHRQPQQSQFLPSPVTPTTEPKTIDSNEAAEKYKGVFINGKK